MTRSPWEGEDGHCLQTNNYLHPFNVTDFRHLAQGDLSPAFWLFVSGVYTAPLRFQPGSQFDYSNTNFILAAYIVEVVSRLSFTEYVTRHILKPAELDETVYDPSFGFRGVRKGTLPGSGYVLRYGGDEVVHDAGPRSGFNKPTVLVQQSAVRALSLSGEGSIAGGAGAMQSSAADLTKWYQTILTRPQVLNLSTAAVDRILTPTVHIRQNTWYGQGVFVMPAPGFPHNASFLYHPGSFWGFRSLMAVKVDRQNASQSQILAVLGNRAIETEAPEGAGQACLVQDANLGIGLPVPCEDIQSFLLFEMLQLAFGALQDGSMPEREDLQQIMPCHLRREEAARQARAV